MNQKVHDPSGFGQLSPEKIPVGRTLVKEGKNLPNSNAERVGGISLTSRNSRMRIGAMRRQYSMYSQSGGYAMFEQQARRMMAEWSDN